MDIYIYIYTQQDKTSTTYRIVYRRIASIFLLFFPASAAATVFVVCLFYLFYFASTLVAFDSTRLPLPSAKCTKKKKEKKRFTTILFTRQIHTYHFPPPSLTTSPFVYISIYLLPRLFPPYVLRVSLHRIHIYIYIPNSFFDPTLFFSFPYPFFFNNGKELSSQPPGSDEKKKQTKKQKKKITTTPKVSRK
ncbi:conserved hypothetical protein, unlikely [Trypanosoma brucei gambiense DAL972]|uniref:Uncharacterized protein n=1 Tax=Trypanosoma brucei gambiense (strain MHOM/CI/86/DAL972) TaxID=679716 RepID=C9ZYP5_TRYB9|nr:conserved hypothetical protein, unlikely [Trypanosoma brucei gambiense DAL972]CBH14544.1 conserved hypothetical protein, unlikely [Trypanosoma brucei gambiense DAL972]|eukprot:XP_011776810.1 conserved hypothetical protein, unlikely [Trypanosoma brucei gambiense DAL972]